MRNLNNTIELLVYGYEPGKYMPIRINGKLSNKREFVAYKVRQLLHR